MSDHEKIGGTIVLIVVFLGFFILLLANIPPEMIVAQSKQFYEYGYEETWRAEEIGMDAFQYYLEYNVTYGTFSPVTFDYGSENLSLVLRAFFWPDSYGNKVISIEHLYWYWGPFYQWDDMQVINASKTHVNLAECLAYWIAADDRAEFYPVFCDHKTGITLIVKDHNATRNDLTASFAENIVTVGLGMGFYIEAGPVAINGWTLIAQLLTFQSPTIFGLTGFAATAINTMISIAVWTMLCYLVYRLILMAIPFVGG